MSGGGAIQNQSPSRGLSYLMVALTGVALVLAVAYYVALGLIRQRISTARGPAWTCRGAFVLPHWHGGLRNLVVLLVFCVLILPSLMIFMSGIFAFIMAPVEGWALGDAFEYELSNFADLANGLTSLVPSTNIGMVVDTYASALTMLLSTFCMGLAAGLAFMLHIASQTPTGVLGLLRLLFIYVPAMLLLMSAASGCVLALIEGWDNRDGMLFMASAFLGNDTPLTSVVPSTSWGIVFIVYAQVVGLTVSGAVVGIVGSHPTTSGVIDFLEGVPEDGDTRSRSSSDAGSLDNGANHALSAVDSASDEGNGSEDHKGSARSRILC